MRRAELLVGAALLVSLVVGLVGCGGGGGTTGQNTVGVSGRVDGVADPETLSLALDGQPLQVRPLPDGSFTIPGVPPGEHVLSVIAPDGTTGVHVDIDVGDGGTTNVGDVEVDAGGRISGTVLQVLEDGSLKPLEGIQVVAALPVVWVTGEGTTTPPGGWDGNTDVWPIPGERPTDVKIVGFTDDAGRYLLEAVPPGEYEVRVVVPGLETGVQWVYVSPGETAVADFQLRQAIEPGIATIEGQVTSTDGGSPIAGAVVSINTGRPYVPVIPAETVVPGRGRLEEPTAAWFDLSTFATLTDQQGKYHLNVPSGYLDLSVFAEGFDPIWRQITLQPDESVTLDIALSLMPGWPPEPALPPVDEGDSGGLPGPY